MLSNVFLEIIILLVLVNCLGKKIIPQVILMFLTVFVGVEEFMTGNSDFQYLFFFAAIVLNSGLLIMSYDGKKDNEGEEE